MACAILFFFFTSFFSRHRSYFGTLKKKKWNPSCFLSNHITSVFGWEKEYLVGLQLDLEASKLYSCRLTMKDFIFKIGSTWIPSLYSKDPNSKQIYRKRKYFQFITKTKRQTTEKKRLHNSIHFVRNTKKKKIIIYLFFNLH